MQKAVSNGVVGEYWNTLMPTFNIKPMISESDAKEKVFLKRHPNKNSFSSTEILKAHLF